MVAQHSLGTKMHSQQATLIIYAVVICLVLVLRGRRVGQHRPLRLEYLWIVPAIYAVFAAFMFYETPIHGIGWLWAALALGAGAVAGWWRGSSIHISVDPETHALNQKMSWATLGFVLVLLLIRRGLSFEAMARGFNPGLIIDLLIMFALGLLTVSRLEMFLRAKRMLKDHLTGTLS